MKRWIPLLVLVTACVVYAQPEVIHAPGGGAPVEGIPWPLEFGGTGSDNTAFTDGNCVEAFTDTDGKLKLHSAGDPCGTGSGGGGTECSSAPCSLNASTTLNGSTIQVGPLSGDVVTSGAVATIQANSVALGTDTTGGYAASVSEGGPATTATALAANGSNCSAGSYARGVDASGAAENCTTAPTECSTSSCNLNASTTLNSKQICLADGSNCPAGAAGTTLTADSGGTTTGTTLGILGTADGIDTTRSGDDITISFDPTEVGDTTFGNNVDADVTWTFNPSGVTNPTIDFLNGQIVLTGPQTQIVNTGGDGVVVNSSGLLAATGAGSVRADDVQCSACISSSELASGVVPTPVPTPGSDPALSAKQCNLAQDGIVCEGTTANGFEGKIDPGDPTADRTWTFQDQSGSIALLEDDGQGISNSGGTFSWDPTEMTSFTFGAGSTSTITAASSISGTTDDPSLIYEERGIRIASTGLAHLALDDADIANSTAPDFWAEVSCASGPTCGVTFTRMFGSGNPETFLSTSTSGSMTLGGASVTSLTVTTDGTGNGEVVLPTGSIGSAEILDGTITSSDLANTVPTPQPTITIGPGTPFPVGSATPAAGSGGYAPLNHIHELAQSGVTAGSYNAANITVDKYGRVTSATSSFPAPAFNLFIDVNGTNSTTCGSPSNPCRDATGTNGAIQKILTNNDNGSQTCTTDTDAGCMRCTGTAVSASAAPAGNKCNANPPWDTDCAAGGAGANNANGSMCSDYTCGGDSTKGCAFFCTTATTVPCLYNTDCPNRDTCNTGGTCSGGTCSGGPRNGLSCAFNFQCATNTCGGTDYCQNPALATNSVCGGGSTCTSGPKVYQLNYSAGNFNDYFDNSDSTHTIPPGLGAGSVTFRGAGRTATTLYGTINSGAHFDTTNKGGSFYDIRLSCEGTAPCIGSTGSGPITMSNATVRYRGGNIGISMTGYGNRYNTWENSWVYGPGGKTNAVLFENYAPYMCSNDDATQCPSNNSAGDLQCSGGGKCTSYTCSNDHSNFCASDADCSGGGKCRPTAASGLFEYQGSDELYMDKMLFQPGCLGTGSAAIDIIGKGTGSSYFNNRIINSTLFMDDTCGTTVTGIKLSRSGSCSGGTCPTTSPEVMIQGLHVNTDISPFDYAVDVGASTKLIVQDMDYDACRRTVTGVISYSDGSANHYWGGGENDLGELYCTAPPNPQDGESWTYSGRRYMRRSGTTYEALDAVITSGATGDTYYRDASGNIVNRAIGSTGQVLTVSGGIPTWAGVSNATTNLLVPAGVMNPQSIGVTGDTSVASANDMYCAPFIPQASLSFTKMGFYLKTGSNSTNCGFAIYSADGSSRIATTGAVSCGAAQSNSVRSTTVSSATINAGTTYRMCWTCDSTTPTVLSVPIDSPLNILANNYSTRNGKAANGGSSGAPPSTTGSITTGTQNMMVGILSAE